LQLVKKYEQEVIVCFPASYKLKLSISKAICPSFKYIAQSKTMGQWVYSSNFDIKGQPLNIIQS